MGVKGELRDWVEQAGINGSILRFQETKPKQEAYK